MEISVKYLAELLNGTIEGKAENKKISQIAKIQDAQRGSISFLSNKKYEPYIYTTQATAVIVNKDFIPKKALQATLIRVEDAYSSLSILLAEYQKLEIFAKKGIEQPAYVDATATLAKNVYIGAFSYIGNNVKIGENAKIFPQVHIEDNSEIGESTIVYPGVQIHRDTKIGAHCTIHSGAVIGSAGFMPYSEPNNKYQSDICAGNVVINDWVDIGANTIIECPVQGTTLIEQGVKLDNLIQVGYATTIKRNTVMAAQSGISRAVTIGQNCMIGGQVGVAEQVQIANGVKVAAGTVVRKPISTENISVMGYTMMEIRDFLKAQAIFKKLPELMKRVEVLEKNKIH